MKITINQLRKIIKEEVKRAHLTEAPEESYWVHLSFHGVPLGAMQYSGDFQTINNAWEATREIPGMEVVIDREVDPKYPKKSGMEPIT